MDVLVLSNILLATASVIVLSSPACIEVLDARVGIHMLLLRSLEYIDYRTNSTGRSWLGA